MHLALASALALIPFDKRGYPNRPLIGLVLGIIFGQVSLTASWCALGPGKFVLVAAAIVALRHFNLMDYVAFVLGCVTVQVVVIAMALFHLLGQRDAGRSLNEIYVQPHLKNKPHA